jgi:hypothetical protein
MAKSVTRRKPPAASPLNLYVFIAVTATIMVAAAALSAGSPDTMPAPAASPEGSLLSSFPPGGVPLGNAPINQPGQIQGSSPAQPPPQKLQGNTGESLQSALPVKPEDLNTLNISP